MDKVAIVSGARRGIGLGIAKALLDNGYKVVLSAFSREGGEEVEALVGNGDAIYIPCDIADASQRKNLFAQALAAFGRIDVLVNNAGVAPKARMDVLETTEENFDYVLKTNLYGTFFMCQLAANEMLRLKRELGGRYSPRIINISSISAYTASVSRAEYSISKAGIAMATQVFAARLAEHGIPVFEVRPGIIDTDMISSVKQKYDDLIEDGLLPIPRLGTPGDVAGCVLAACSGLLDYTSGQVLNADGGFHIRRL